MAVIAGGTEERGDIPFTQYLLPDGKAIDVWVTCPYEIARKARKVIALGYFFEAEFLPDGGLVSLTVTDRGEGEELGHELVHNGPAVQGAVIRLVEGVYAKLFTEKGKGFMEEILRLYLGRVIRGLDSAVDLVESNLPEELIIEQKGIMGLSWSRAEVLDPIRDELQAFSDEVDQLSILLSGEK